MHGLLGPCFAVYCLQHPKLRMEIKRNSCACLFRFSVLAAQCWIISMALLGMCTLLHN